MFDIVIVGSGISGLILASLLDQKYNILLIEKRRMDGERFDAKSCGGMLNPNAQKALASIGISLPKEVLASSQPFGLKILDLSNKLSAVYQKSYINMNREKFEQFLKSKIGKNVQFVDQACFKKMCTTGHEKIEVEYLKEKVTHKVETKFLVASDGADSRVRKSLFGAVALPRYVTIQEHYKWDQEEPYYYGIADSSITDFYSWMIPKEHSIILGSSLNKKRGEDYDANRRFELLKSRLKEVGFDFTKQSLIKKEGSILLRPTSMRQLRFRKGRVALIGEAAGLISPSSSEGISYAINSARHLANCLNQSLEEKSLKIYEKKVKRIARKMIFKKFLGYIMYNDFLRNMIIRSKLKSIQVYNGKKS